MDHHSKLLISLKSNGQSSASEISDTIIGWKNTFSFYWYHQYINDDQKKLDYVFNLLFELTEFPDPNVTIASFNAIGALLVSLSPFRSQELISSFKNALSSLEVSPNTSCAVIATFVFLSHHVSDNSISHFIDSTPIFPHFGADLRTFIHHIPNLIEQMDRLNMEFHQALLRSLISSFGRNPVSSFIESIMLLIKRFPNKLLSDLMEFIESNKLGDTLLSVGGPILNNDTFSEILSIQQKYKFLNALKNKILIPKSESESNQNETDTTFVFNESDYELQTEVTATELEQTVSIICGLRKQSEEELRKIAKTVSDYIWDHRSKLKSVFQRILFPLANNIDELRPTKDDSSNEMSRKIMALDSLENADDEEILSICEPFIDSRDECFISVLTFLAKSMKEKCHRLFQKLFEKDDYSWVQRIAILNLIDSMDQFKMETFISDYNQKCIDFLIKCALSLQTELSSQSRSVISRFISLNNVEMFRDSILKCDFFNFQITKNILMLLNVIVNSISPTPLRCFIGIVLELFDFTLSDIISNDSDDSVFEGINIYPPFVSDCFEFLSHYPGLFQYRKSIERICMCKMQEIYYSFTQEKLFFQSMLNNSSQGSSANNEVVSQASQMLHSNRKKAQAASQMLKNNVRPILSTITTDVVADASLVKYEFLKPLENCLQYLVSNQMQSAAYRSVFLKLLPIFPKEILPYFYEQASVITNCRESNRISFLSPEEIELIRPKILRIFNSNRDQFVIARCCEFFYQSNIINQQILIQVKNIVENTKIKTSSSAFEFFKLIYSVEPENAMNYLKRMLNISDNNDQEKSNEKIILSDLTKNELALLASNIPFVYKLLSELDDFSFLQFRTNRFSAKSWFERNDYASWPLTDSDLIEEIKKMFDKSYSVRVKDCSLIDNQHWTFLMKNKTLFYRDTIKEYLNSNKYLLKSICIFSTISDDRNHFDFSEKIQKDIEENLDKFARFLPTAALLFKKGKFVKNETLIKNFLRFSKIQISDDLLNKMKEEFPYLSNNFDEYKTRLAKKQMKKENLKTISDRIVITKSDENKKEEQNKETVQIQQIETKDKNSSITEEKQADFTEIKKDEKLENDEQVVKMNEENQVKNDQLNEEQKINQEEQHNEGQMKSDEQNLNNNNNDDQTKPEENQAIKDEKHEQEENQIKSEEQKEENQVKNEDENQIKQEEQQQPNQEVKNDENQEDHHLESNEHQKQDEQVKSDEQKDESQIKQEEDHQQLNQEEHKEENEIKQEQQQHLDQVSDNQKEENEIKQQEEHQQQSIQEEQKIEIQVKQEEEQQPNQEEQKEENEIKQEQQQQHPNQEEQKEENEVKQEQQQQHPNQEEQKIEIQVKQEEEQHQTQPEQHQTQPEQHQTQPDQHQNNQEDLHKPEEPVKIQSEDPTPPKTEVKQIPNHQHKNHSQIHFTIASSISDFDPNFPMKSKFLKILCNQPPKDAVVVTMYRMHLINRINEIRRPKQYFYFLRFLRISLAIFKNSRETLAIRKNTIENFGPIAIKLRELAIGRNNKQQHSSNLDQEESDFDFYEEEKDLSFVLLEFVKLSSKLFLINELHRVIKTVSVPGKTDSIELLLVSNLVIHSSKFRNMVNNVFSLSNNLLSNYSIHQLKSSNLARLPSFLSFIIMNIKILPDEESSMFFTRHYQHLIDNDIVSDLAIEFLSFYIQFQQNGKQYEDYFDGNVIVQIALLLFDTKRSIFKRAGEKSLLQMLFTLMKGQFKNQLLQFEQLIEKLPVCGYSLPFAIDLATSYFSTVAFNIFQIPITQNQQKILESIELKEKQSKKGKSKILTDEQKRQNILNFQKDFGIKEIRIVQSIYQVCPSITNALKLSKTLILASSYFDSLALIFGKLAPFEDGSFLGIFCIASLFYFEFINDDDKRKRFIDLVNNFEIQNSTFKSRVKALKLIIDNKNDDSLNFEVAFTVACLETNDNSQIEEVINLFAE